MTGESGGGTLSLLDRVAWCGRAVPGERAHALLAALALDPGRSHGDARLVAEVWSEGPEPANPVKALQVLVSRLRGQTDPGIVVRAGQGYRLGPAHEAVDALALRSLVERAGEAESAGDLSKALDLARSALSFEVADGPGGGPLADLRALARTHLGEAGAIAGRAASGAGEHEVAVALLEQAGREDEATLAALLRSEAALRGAASALERYERHRVHLRDTLGVDPGPRLQEVQAELLGADSPVRQGVRHDASSLVGREQDLRSLRALVRESRVTSVVGPGGLGKTRVAHVLGQEASQPVVHFVELAGVSSPEDVVGEVASVLGVRESVSGRRVLTTEQRTDARARIAQLLDQAPTLLILDNCEHVVEAVADLVAYLVAAAPRMRVVTTTRAPLAIAAERVFPLGQLADDAAVELFGQRARSARPGVLLDEDAVGRVVRRLDGLPLAIELAAAKVRAMSVADIDRRLDDRFALLRGGDRSAPDRHQTLLAVIDWSWDLLDEPERRGLRWFSVFPDGFTLESAEALLGHDPLDVVQALVDQSLVTVVDARGTVRYRMLETVREYGLARLGAAGEQGPAREALLSWACGIAAREADRLWSGDQVDAVRRLGAEENNLADCLRAALALPDPPRTVRLLASLGSLWTIKGENARVIALAGAVEEALQGWEPEPGEVEVAVAGAAVLAMNTIGVLLGQVPVTISLIDRYADDVGSAGSRGMVEVVRALDPADPQVMLDRLTEIGRGPDRGAAVLALMWAAHHRENSGDPEGALEEATRGLALTRPEDDGPWLAALLRTLLAALHGQLGRHAEAAEHAALALPVLDQIGAQDDAIQVRSLLAVHAMVDGRLEEAEELIDRIERIDDRSNFLGTFVVSMARAELALARGDVEAGLGLYRRGLVDVRAIRFPGLVAESGLEPWTLYGESAAVSAYAVHGSERGGEDLYDALRVKAPQVLAPGRGHLDFPVAGLVLHGLGAWGLLREALPLELAVRLLVLAERFAYARLAPTLASEHTDAVAERRGPGLLDRVRAEYAARRGPDLLEEARAVVGRLTG